MQTTAQALRNTPLVDGRDSEICAVDADLEQTTAQYRTRPVQLPAARDVQGLFEHYQPAEKAG
jgi:hypothetical protein